MSHSVDISQVASRWPQLLAAVRSGDEIILTESNVPLAKLMPLAKRIPNLHAGDFEISSDFDEPLTEEFLIGKDHVEPV